MAKGKQRIRQRGSRQQWAHARDYKEFGPEPAADESAQQPPGAAPVSFVRCGRCNGIAEQRLGDGGVELLLANVSCARCGALRCEDCWEAEDDPCPAGEHEFLEVRYAEGRQVHTADFATWEG